MVEVVPIADKQMSDDWNCIWKKNRNWEPELPEQEKNILLLIENYSAHSRIDNLVDIKLAILPTNLTTKVYIQSVNCYYRKNSLFRAIEYLDKRESVTITMLNELC